MKKDYVIFPLGDSALTIDFGNAIAEAINKKVLSLAGIISKASIPGIKDIVPAYSSLTVHYNISNILKYSNGKTAYETVKAILDPFINTIKETEVDDPVTIRIPVCYDEPYGWDLHDLSIQTGLSAGEIVQLHTSRSYRVYMVGFLPGFAYMGEVDDRIAIARKATPRVKVDAGCVGIAGKQTGIYPLASPGGWQIIGRTPVKIFDIEKANPVLLRAGNYVTFYSIAADEFDHY